MGHISKKVALVATLSWILSYILVAASPMDAAGGLVPRSIENSHDHTIFKDLDKREDEDDDPDEVDTYDTGPIRDGMIDSRFGELACHDGKADGQQP